MPCEGTLTFWMKFKMSMGMDHTGLAGREMAMLMEEDVWRTFIFALIFTVLIIDYSPLGAKIIGLQL
jgi:hypothetical protein